MITIGQLRAAIEGMPDDAQVDLRITDETVTQDLDLELNGFERDASPLHRLNVCVTLSCLDIYGDDLPPDDGESFDLDDEDDEDDMGPSSRHPAGPTYFSLDGDPTP